MQTSLLEAAKPSSITRAAEIIRAGGLVAFPTETVYGLGANALDDAAVQKIFAAKERPAWDPLIVHVTGIAMLEQVATGLPPQFEGLRAAFMPGPLTLVLKKRLAVPAATTASRNTVAVRFPSHPVARALIEAAGMPIAAPSANRFSRVSPTRAEHVLKDLDGRIDALLDGGPCEIGVESTVLDLTLSPPRILRHGGITREQLVDVLGSVESGRAHREEPGEAMPSPGMMARHYAPRTQVVLSAGDATSLMTTARQQRGRVGILLPTGWEHPANSIPFECGRWGDWKQWASCLFAGLRWLDEQQLDVIVAPLPPDEGLGAAVAERLRKAAAPR